MCRTLISTSPTRCKANATGYFPYTPALPMLYGLREALAILDEEGLENVFARHHHLAGGARAAVEAWGLKLCAKEPKWHSDTVTAIMVPPASATVAAIAVAGRVQGAGELCRYRHISAI